MTDDVLLPKMATVTSKMQVTIPVRFARKYGLKPGSKVSLGVKDRAIIVTPLEPIGQLKPFRRRGRHPGKAKEATRA